MNVIVASLEPYAAIGVTLLMVITLTAIIMVLAHTVGPKRHGPVKDSPYESGMPVVGDTHRRFNIRFYIVAVLFLLFDVELIFVWPWITVFHHAATTAATYEVEGGGQVGKGFLLVGMGVFLALLVFGLAYEWKRGALEWD